MEKYYDITKFNLNNYIAKIPNNYFPYTYIPVCENFVRVFGNCDYLIGDVGTVLSLKNNTITPLKPRINHSGYLYVDLCTVNGIERFFIHTLVALHYIDNPEPNNFTIINHLDGNPANNYKYNLQWCNNRMNNIHKLEVLGNAPVGVDSYNALFTEEQVLDIYHRATVLGESYANIARDYNVGRDRVRCIAIGQTYNSVTNHLKKQVMFTTYKENGTILNARGRVPRTGPQKGSARYNAVLDEEKVLEMKRLFKDTDLSDNEIAEMFNLKRRHVNQIRNNKIWKHVILDD